MAETDVDRRRYSIVLVSHGVLDPVPGAAGRDRARRIVRWAADHGHGLYQLPPAGYRIAPAASEAERRRLGREDGEGLVFVFSQLRAYVDAGYRVSGVILDAADVAGPQGRAWIRRLLRAAETQAVAVPDPVRLAADDDLAALDAVGTDASASAAAGIAASTVVA